MKSFRLFARPLCFTILLALLSGCGGGGGSAPGGGLPGGEITDERRDAAIDTVWNKFQTLTHKDPVADAKTMVAFMKAQPEFADAGFSSDLTVWGQFTDGPMYALVNNDPDLGAGRAASTPYRRPSSSRGRAGRMTIPTGSDVHLLHGFFNDRPNISDQIEQMLNKAEGYNIHKGPATLEAFKAVGGNTGLLVTNMHAGRCPDPADKTKEHIYLVTNSAVPPRHPHKGEPLYDDWKAGRIYLFGTVVNNRVIGIGPGWVQQNMSFGPNSLWINNACMAYNDEFSDAAFHKNLGTYVGWDESVHFEVANAAALFIVDRLTGANVETAHKEDPAQRAFQLWMIMDDLRSRDGLNPVTNPKMDHSLWVDLDTSNLLNTKLTDAHLQSRDNPFSGGSTDTFGFLAPSIEILRTSPTGNNELTLSIDGLFGATPGKVTIDDKEVTVKKWGASTIDVLLPPGDQPGASGDVVVEVNGHKSNPVPLTMWTLKIHAETETTYSGTIVYEPAGMFTREIDADLDGKTNVSGDLTLYVRADVHEHRSRPGQKPPLPPQGSFIVTSNARKTQNAKVTSWSGSGSETIDLHYPGESVYDHRTLTLSKKGSGPVLFDGSDPRAQTGLVGGEINPETHVMKLYPGLGAVPLFTVTETSSQTHQTTENDGGGIYFYPGNNDNGPIRFDIHLGQDFSVQSGSYSDSASGNGSTTTRKFSWSGTVSHAPEPDTARTAKLRTAGRTR